MPKSRPTGAVPTLRRGRSDAGRSLRALLEPETGIEVVAEADAVMHMAPWGSSSRERADTEIADVVKAAARAQRQVSCSSASARCAPADGRSSQRPLLA